MSCAGRPPQVRSRHRAPAAIDTGEARSALGRDLQQHVQQLLSRGLDAARCVHGRDRFADAVQQRDNRAARQADRDGAARARSRSPSPTCACSSAPIRSSRCSDIPAFIPAKRLHKAGCNVLLRRSRAASTPGVQDRGPAGTAGAGPLRAVSVTRGSTMIRGRAAVTRKRRDTRSPSPRSVPRPGDGATHARQEHVQVPPLMVTGLRVTKDGKPITPATINRYLATLSIACGVAVREWGWLDDNPV
jgi:hypothetical protein